ncbi:hypothetical protein HED60_08485 [Planctomycetales bacterium ZRK34]|nr:hypothetical protein HED60_08485 [Planctomycetales bacterium ZRK34]
MDRRKKAWMATLGAILIGHAYGEPSESMPLDHPPLAVHQDIDMQQLIQVHRRLIERRIQDAAPSHDHTVRANIPPASECP